MKNDDMKKMSELYEKVDHSEEILIQEGIGTWLAGQKGAWKQGSQNKAAFKSAQKTADPNFDWSSLGKSRTKETAKQIARLLHIYNKFERPIKSVLDNTVNQINKYINDLTNLINRDVDKTVVTSLDIPNKLKNIQSTIASSLIDPIKKSIDTLSKEMESYGNAPTAAPAPGPAPAPGSPPPPAPSTIPGTKFPTKVGGWNFSKVSQSGKKYIWRDNKGNIGNSPAGKDPTKAGIKPGIN